MPHPSPRFAIILQPTTEEEPIVLDAAPDPDQATLRFHQARTRLKRDRVVGELLVILITEEARTNLDEPLTT